MFVLDPDPYSLPCYRIGPFTTRYLTLNQNLPQSNDIDNYFQERFSGKKFIYTINGRKAINLALNHYKPKKDDVVTILTTTGNFYISSCVTREIEKFCQWSREVVPETKILFVNHEFGFPHPNLRELKKYNLPIIEDCANTFFSKDKENDIGEVGDFVIYSFPKMFPIQIGGLLKINIPGFHKSSMLQEEERKYVSSVLSHEIQYKDEIIKKRKDNYRFLKEKFGELGFKERFPSENGVVPGVFMFSTVNSGLDLPELKKHFYAHGIQCSVFYGEEAFFIPSHQNLTEEDMLYFYGVMKHFLNNHKE